MDAGAKPDRSFLRQGQSHFLFRGDSLPLYHAHGGKRQHFYGLMGRLDDSRINESIVDNATHETALHLGILSAQAFQEVS